MNWTKLGRIFDPTQFDLPNGCLEFAQAPQALILTDRVRVFFSTRTRGATDKSLSHVAFADFDAKFRIIEVATHPVLRLGNLGCYDEHGIFPLNVVRHGDTIWGYIGGWSRRVSVPVEGAIGLAISHDQGLTFQRMGDGPILASSAREPYMLADPFVLIIDGVHHMWYIFGTSWKRYAGSSAPERVYKIGHATSGDGVSWQRSEAGRQIIENRLGPDECQALPTVVTLHGRHHMLFCYREASGFRTDRTRGYRFGYALSHDLVHWQRVDELVGIGVTKGDWDSDMLCYPHIFQLGGETYLLYNGNEFGRLGFGLARLDSA